MWVKVDAFSAFGCTSGAEMNCPRQSATVALNRTFRGGELEILIAQSFEEGAYRLNVTRQVRAESDDIAEISRIPLHTLGNLIDHVNEPTGWYIAVPSGMTSDS